MLAKINNAFRAIPSFIASEPTIPSVRPKVLPNSLLGRKNTSPSLPKPEYSMQPGGLRALLSLYCSGVRLCPLRVLYHADIVESSKTPRSSPTGGHGDYCSNEADHGPEDCSYEPKIRLLSRAPFCASTPLPIDSFRAEK